MMRNVIVAIIFILSFQGMSHAQRNFGLKAGVGAGLPLLEGGASLQFAWHFGAYACSENYENVNAQAELLLFRNYLKERSNKIRDTYIKVPLLLKLGTGETRIMVGVQPGMLLTAREQVFRPSPNGGGRITTEKSTARGADIVFGVRSEKELKIDFRLSFELTKVYTSRNINLELSFGF